MPKKSGVPVAANVAAVTAGAGATLGPSSSQSPDIDVKKRFPCGSSVIPVVKISLFPDTKTVGTFGVTLCP